MKSIGALILIACAGPCTFAADLVVNKLQRSCGTDSPSLVDGPGNFGPIKGAAVLLIAQEKTPSPTPKGLYAITLSTSKGLVIAFSVETDAAIFEHLPDVIMAGKELEFEGPCVIRMDLDGVPLPGTRDVLIGAKNYWVTPDGKDPFATKGEPSAPTPDSKD